MQPSSPSSGEIRTAIATAFVIKARPTTRLPVVRHCSPLDFPLEVSPTAINFGKVRVDTDKLATVTLTHETLCQDTEPLTISNATYSLGCFSTHAILKSGHSVTWPVSLLKEESAQLVVKFHPTGTGTFTGSLSIFSDATNRPSPFDVQLVGEGSVPPCAQLEVSKPPVTDTCCFVGETCDVADIEVKNTCAASNGRTIVIRDIHIEGDTAFKADHPTPSISLAPGGTISIHIKASPATSGTKTAQLVIENDSDNQKEARIDLKVCAVIP